MLEFWEARFRLGIETFRGQHADGHAPRFLDGLLGAGQTVGLEMGHTLKATTVGHHEFTAPNRAIDSVAGPVERNPDEGFMQIVLGHHAGDVRMVMLDPDLVRDPRNAGIPGG